MPGTRTDYVSAQTGHQLGRVGADTGPELSPGVQRGDPLVHGRHDGHQRLVLAGRAATRRRRLLVVERYDTFIQFNVQPWADGGVDHAGYLTRATTWNEDLPGRTLVSTSRLGVGLAIPGSDWQLDVQAGSAGLPGSAAVWRLSPKTHTVWNVVSQPVTDPDEVDLMPLMQLDYHVQTDLAGDAQGGWQTVGLTGQPPARARSAPARSPAARCRSRTTTERRCTRSSSPRRGLARGTGSPPSRPRRPATSRSRRRRGTTTATASPRW